MHELISKCQKSLITVDKYYDAALQHVRGELIVNGKLSRDNLDREQHAAHGLSWVAAYRATLKEMGITVPMLLGLFSLFLVYL